MNALARLPAPGWPKRRRSRMHERGQATVEYALVLVAAAAVALALLVWVTETELLARFFNAVLRRVTAGVG